jgi:signal recognition particle subunit SRP54
MFQQLSERLNKVIKNLTGQGRLTEKNIEDTLRDIRIALLEADVALPVIKQFLEQIHDKAIGKDVIESLNPGQVLVKLVHDELVTIMGEANETLNLRTAPPAIILVAGLQGSGKTTTVAKLARWLKTTQKKSVAVVSTDVYRPAAIDQLATLAKQHDLHHIESHAQEQPVEIAKRAVQAAKNKVVDVLFVDTAGRLHIDEAMMAEIKALHAATQPVETLFVIDSMMGQDAVNTAKAFHEALPLTGIILTKTDGDAKGGAALSVRMITGKPIKFIGTGEKIEALELFHPDRMASRILGMGDIVSLVEEAEQKIDKAKAEKLAKKIHKGHFDLEDFRDQLKQIKSMGGLAGIMGKLPQFNQLQGKIQDQLDDKKWLHMEAIINSMTPKERRFPDNIRHSQKCRIALGSGTSVQAVNQLLKQFLQMQKMMKKMSQGGNMMRRLQGMMGAMQGGQFPPLQ